MSDNLAYLRKLEAEHKELCTPLVTEHDDIPRRMIEATKITAKVMYSLPALLEIATAARRHLTEMNNLRYNATMWKIEHDKLAESLDKLNDLKLEKP